MCRTLTWLKHMGLLENHIYWWPSNSWYNSRSWDPQGLESSGFSVGAVCFFPLPLTLQEDTWQCLEIFLVVTAGDQPLVGRGQGCCWTSHSVQDTPRKRELPGPQCRLCWGGEALIHPCCDEVFSPWPCPTGTAVFWLVPQANLCKVSGGEPCPLAACSVCGDEQPKIGCIPGLHGSWERWGVPSSTASQLPQGCARDWMS